MGDLEAVVDSLPHRSQLDIALPVLIRLLATPSPPNISHRITALPNGLDIHGTHGTPSSIVQISSPTASPTAGTSAHGRCGNALLRSMNPLYLNNADNADLHGNDALSPSPSVSSRMLDSIPREPLSLPPSQSAGLCDIPQRMSLTAHLLATRALYALTQNSHGACILLEISMGLADQPWRSFLDFLSERLRTFDSWIRDAETSAENMNGETMPSQRSLSEMQHKEAAELVEVR